MTNLRIIVVAFLALACVPPKPGGFDDGHTTTTSSNGSDTQGSGDETGDETETETETSATTDETFIPQDDHSDATDCDIFQQDCPDGEKCMPYASSGGTWDANKCVPVLGDQIVGEPCNYHGPIVATDDCDATSMCWEGTCHALCGGSPDVPECPEGSVCVVGGDGVVALCIPRCDPLAQDCQPGTACFWDGTDFGCVHTTLDIPTGEPCGFINDCAAGNMCVDAILLPSCNGASCCASFCNIETGDPDCEGSPETVCTAFFEDDEAPPAYEHVGVCITP